MIPARKPYQMYVLNLDASRIFWLSVLFIFIIVLSFFIGFLNGKGLLISEKHRPKIEFKIDKEEDFQVTRTVGVDREAVISKEVEDFQFFNSKELDFERAEVVPEKKKLPVIRRVKAEKKTIAVQDTDLSRFGDVRLSSSSPYTVQISSYRIFRNAKRLKGFLSSKNYPAYIIKAKVNGNIYFRVRVGPFTSRILANRILYNVKKEQGCSESYIASK